MMRRMDLCTFQSLKTWLFDCDGVLWHGSKVIPGAKELVERLQNEGKQVLFITNNSLKSRKEYCEKFTSLGFKVNEKEIACTAYVAAQYLKNIGFKDKVYLMGTHGMAKELDNLGIRHVGLGPDPVVDEDMDYTAAELDPEVKCVLVGLDRYISYLKIFKAASYIKSKKCMFVATNDDSCFPMVGKDLTMPGTGSIVHSVAVASDTQPVVVGKPHPPMFETLRDTLHLDPSSSIIVGDRLNTDIALGSRSGLISVLVLTGISSSEEAARLPEADQPHFVMPSVKEIAEL